LDLNGLGFCCGFAQATSFPHLLLFQTAAQIKIRGRSPAGCFSDAVWRRNLVPPPRGADRTLRITRRKKKTAWGDRSRMNVL
jgi:hypothetical protein